MTLPTRRSDTRKFITVLLVPWAVLAASVQNFDSVNTTRGMSMERATVRTMPNSPSIDSLVGTQGSDKTLRKLSRSAVAPDSVRAAFKSDSSAKSGIADTAGKAGAAYGFFHNVTPEIVPVASNSYQFENSMIKSTDTVIIKAASIPAATDYDDTVSDGFDVSENPLEGWWDNYSGPLANDFISSSGGYGYCYGKTGISFCNLPFLPNQTALCEEHGDGGMSEGLIVRGDHENGDGYYFTIIVSGRGYLYKMSDGVRTYLDTTTTNVPSTGYLRLDVVGDSLFASTDDSTYPGHPLLKARDTEFSTGQPGIRISNGRTQYWNAWPAARSTYTDTFTNTSLSTLTFNAGCSAPNGDCYFSYGGSPFQKMYIQYGGSGPLVDLAQTARAWTAATSIPNGNVYYAVTNDSIYKRTGGAGNFVRINKGYNLSGMTYSQKDNKIYLSGQSKVYEADTGMSTVTDLGVTVAQYIDLCAMKNGDLYATIAGSSTVMVRKYGETNFSVFQVFSVAVSYIWRDSSDNLYIAKGYHTRDGGYSVYRKLSTEEYASWYQAFPGQITIGYDRPNGEMYLIGTTGNVLTGGFIYTKGTEITRTIFNVSGGDSKFDGKINAENVPYTNTPASVLVQEAFPDNTIKKTSPSNITVGSSDTLNTPGNGQLLYSNNGVADTFPAKYNPSGKYIDFPSMITLSDSNSYSVPGFIYRHVKTADSLTATTAWGFANGNPGTGMSSVYGSWIYGETNAQGGRLQLACGDSGEVHFIAPKKTQTYFRWPRGHTLEKPNVEWRVDDTLYTGWRDSLATILQVGKNSDSSSFRLYGGKGSSSTYSEIEMGSGVSNRITISTDSLVLPENINLPKGAYGNKFKITQEGGYAIKMINRTGATSVKGYLASPSPSYDTSCTLSIVDIPDNIGVFYESGIANGSETWVVVSGIADVYFIGNATRGHIARGFVTGDAGYVAGQALSEAVPSSPFATDKHFYEVGHVIQNRTGAGLAKCVLHQN